MIDALELDQLHEVDALTGLRGLPDESVDCVVTSPPYWAIQDYGVPPVEWADGWKGSLGLEPHFRHYLDHLCEVFDEVRRVLKPSGTVWVNLSDCYSSRLWNNPAALSAGFVSPGSTADGGPGRRPGLREKSLCLIPERFAVRMCDRGWILRNHIVWYKPNHLPSSARDRFSNSWEHVLFFAKSPRYHFDLDGVRIPHETRAPGVASRAVPRVRHSPGVVSIRPPLTRGHWSLHPRGKNPSDWWPIATRASPTAHPAAFPEALCERPILAGCPVGGVVLDPFAGSGTTCVVAQRLGRRFIGFEPNHEFLRRARTRLPAREQQSSTESQAGAAVP